MYGVIILGGGPAGTGPLIWAAQNGRLDWLLDRGVAIVERTAAIGGSLDHYIINADSMGTSFLECLDPPSARAAFDAVCRDDVTRRLELMRYRYPPLKLIAEFERRLGRELAQIVSAHKTCGFIANSTASSIHLHGDGHASVRLAGGETLMARSVVFGLGGHQDLASVLGTEILPGVRLGDQPRDKILPSGRLLTDAGVADAMRILAAAPHRRAIILGGSHSAFSAAWVLLNALPGFSFGDGDLTILHRRPLRVFYASEQAARDDDFVFAERDVCPTTRRVHRMGGLRHDGRELWRRISGRPGTVPEPRARTLALADPDLTPARLKRMLDEAALIVPALGYRFNTLPVFDADGLRVPLMADEGKCAVDRESRMVRGDGTPFDNLFGVGLGSGYRPWGDMAGEPSFDGHQNSLWLYQNGLGRQVFDGVRASIERAAAPPRRAAAALAAG
jgi:hypothetical protein